MNRELLTFLNRYAILGASLTLAGFVLILLIRSQDRGLSAIILAVILLGMAAFFLFIFLNNIRRH